MKRIVMNKRNDDNVDDDDERSLNMFEMFVGKMQKYIGSWWNGNQHW